MIVTENLSPKRVFYYFEEISKIPHGSGNIDRLSDYFVEFARERNLHCIQDEWKNVIIIKEAASGYEKEAPIILQGHMDMVAVKRPDADIDMATEGLRLRTEGDYLYAEGTSLGGDDGIAVAYALAILESADIPHPRLEVVLTVDEEVGMDGARELDVSALRGKRMLNLDSEEEGIILAGCAGGARADWRLPVKWENKEGRVFCLKVQGLSGGHSGMEIDKERGNANCLMGRILADLSERYRFAVAELEGGLADNAIPREASAVIVVDVPDCEALTNRIKDLESEVKSELQTKDPGVCFRLEEIESRNRECLSKESFHRLSYLLLCSPNGVQAMSAEIEGLVETSLNMGIIELDKTEFRVQFSVRSSHESAKALLIKRLDMLANMAGASLEVRGDYPGWAYLKVSPFRTMAIEIYRRIYGKEPAIQAVHAGLECGLLLAKIPGLECISIGPDMKDIHTTEERLSISSTERVWNYILEIIKQK